MPFVSRLESNTSSSINKLVLDEFFNLATARHVNINAISIRCFSPSENLNLIVPHQANIRIIESGAKRLGLKQEKVFANVKKYGNISSASIPVALVEALKEGLVKKGDNLVFVGFGGGLTWGSMLLKWSKE